ncbi:MAG: hypothetical protein M0Z68_00560 [Gammaproteobacteria bacterium]|nr:hypothetical protein [Gammaproteobacteria bacterium]
MSGLEDVSRLTNTSEFRDAVAACGSDYWSTYSAAGNALIDWLLRGQRMEIRRHAEQAAKLRDALDVMNEYRAVIEHNLSGRVIHDPETGKYLTFTPWLDLDSPVNAGPVLNAVASVILQLAADLETRNPVGMADRKDRNIFYCLGRAFAKRGLVRPAVTALRQLGAVIAPHSDTDDANIIHAFDSGCMSAQN